MGGVCVRCWKAVNEIKRSEGSFRTGVQFVSWSRFEVTWDKLAEVGDDHKIVDVCW